MGSNAGVTVKQTLHRIVETLPEDGPQAIEELQDRLYVLEKLRRGERQADAGQTISREQVRERLASSLDD